MKVISAEEIKKTIGFETDSFDDDDSYETIIDRLNTLYAEEPDTWLTTRQVMWAFDVSSRTVYRWIRREDVPHILDEHQGFMYGKPSLLVPISHVIKKMEWIIAHPHD